MAAALVAETLYVLFRRRSAASGSVRVRSRRGPHCVRALADRSESLIAFPNLCVLEKCVGGVLPASRRSPLPTGNPLAFDEAFFEDFLVGEPQAGDIGGAEAEDVFER